MSRPTVAQVRTNRLVKQLQRRALVAKRRAARDAHRAERHTIASHLRSMGVDDTTATAIASTLRRHITPGVKGFAKKDGVRRRCVRYTRAQVLAALAVYKPRKQAYKDVRADLLALAA